MFHFYTPENVRNPEFFSDIFLGGIEMGRWREKG